MKIDREIQSRAQVLHHQQAVQDAFSYLLFRMNKELLSAKTTEERDEKWENYHALARVQTLIGTWAAQAEIPEGTT